jgi:hypothetical protein
MEVGRVQLKSLGVTLEQLEPTNSKDRDPGRSSEGGGRRGDSWMIVGQTHPLRQPSPSTATKSYPYHIEESTSQIAEWTGTGAGLMPDLYSSLSRV